jgi:hypothetical protein
MNNRDASDISEQMKTVIYWRSRRSRGTVWRRTPVFEHGWAVFENCQKMANTKL